MGRRRMCIRGSVALGSMCVIAMGRLMEEADRAEWGGADADVENGLDVFLVLAVGFMDMG
jgi:hypothetical protein